jgi:tetratricopeptide (TPR) repeat protein
VKKTIILVAAVFCICAFNLGFSGIFVSYKSGPSQADLTGAGKWKETALDMELTRASLVRTGASAVLELTIDDEIVSVGPGSLVKVSDIVAKLGEKKKLGVAGSVLKYAKAAAKGGDGPGSTTIAGVRAKKVESTELQWFEETGEDSESGAGVMEELEKGKALFERGSYAHAIQVLQGLFDLDEAAPLKGEISYYVGAALFHSLRYHDSLSYLELGAADRHSYYYEPALIHYSLAEYFEKEYARAIEGFTRYGQTDPQGEMKPYAVFMIGMCYKGIGDTREAERYFREIKESYPESEVYANALEEMKGL